MCKMCKSKWAQRQLEQSWEATTEMMMTAIVSSESGDTGGLEAATEAATEGTNTPRAWCMPGTSSVDADNVADVVYVEMGRVSTSHLQRSAMSCLATTTSDGRTTTTTYVAHPCYFAPSRGRSRRACHPAGGGSCARSRRRRRMWLQSPLVG